jgi:selenobiotic family peptide radical SAM maturase
MLRDRWWRGRSSSSFTLQWHLTNLCHSHCRHCYDRTNRSILNFHEAFHVLDSLEEFGRRHHLKTQISLTGGDPLCHPNFWEIYEEIARRRIPVSLLGNPIQENEIRQLMTITPPQYYQVSLEGFPNHNDFIRGEGHFERTVRFLEIAQRFDLKTHVMATITRDNLDQIVPLGNQLRYLTCLFSFNRLAQVGEGTNLALPEPTEYARFLHHYLKARQDNLKLGVKDNLFNIIRNHFGRAPFRGCTGFGCGAAFNFLALLPDGEFHACRKFPSPVGNITRQTLHEVYYSQPTKLYRRGPEGCQTCSLLKFCRGCPAVVYGQGLDPLKDRDPFCFLGVKDKGQEAVTAF